MLTNGELYCTLETVSKRYVELRAKFAEFSDLLEASFAKDDFFVKGLKVKAELEANRIDIDFAGRTFRLVFSTVISEQQRMLVGFVSCYAVAEYQERKFVPVGSFTFKPSGVSDIKDPTDGDPLCINEDMDAIYIGFHLIYEGLAK